jgi:hypothetical protein
VTPSVGRMGIGGHSLENCVSVASGSNHAVAVPIMDHQNVPVLQVSSEDIPKLVRSVSGLTSLIMRTNLSSLHSCSDWSMFLCVMYRQRIG